MTLAGYRTKEASSVRRRNSLSKKKRRLLASARTAKKERLAKRARNIQMYRAAYKENERPTTGPASVRVPDSTGNYTAISKIVKATKPLVMKEKTAKVSKGRKPLSSLSRRTPGQLNKFQAEQAKFAKSRQLAHESALRLVYAQQDKEFKGKAISIAQIARDATKQFGTEVRGGTLRKLYNSGSKTISKPGPNGKFSSEIYKQIYEALISCIAISHSNGDPEKKASCIVALLEDLLGGNKRWVACPRSLWRKIQRDNAEVFELSKEQVIELRRNENACLALTREGFNGSALRVTLRKKARTLASRLPR
ncbi:MAG: hypothetical protein ACREOZ_03965, partial [Gloeomargaritales cyanobacterium]